MCNCVKVDKQRTVYLGRERKAGNPVEAYWQTSKESGRLLLARGVADIETARHTPSQIEDEVVTSATVGGNLTMPLRVDGASLLCLFSAYEEVVADRTTIAASGSTPDQYIYKLRPTFCGYNFSIHEVTEALVDMVSSGAQLSGLTIAGTKGSNAYFRAETSWQALNQVQYPGVATTAQQAFLGIDTPVEGATRFGDGDFTVLFDDVVDCEAKSISFALTRTLEAKDAACASNPLGPQCLYCTAASVAASSTFYFSNLDLLKRYLGVGPTQVLPFGMTRTIKAGKIAFKITAAAQSNGAIPEIQIVFPNASVSGLVMQGDGNTAIMQDAMIKPRQSVGDGYADHYLLVKTTITPAVIAAYQLELYAVPKNDVQSYNAIPGDVTGVAAAVVTLAASSFFADSTGAVIGLNKYAGLKMRVVEAADTSLIGQEFTIASHPAYTTGTLAVTLAVAPTGLANGDRVSIVGGWALDA